jgi:hypothetical protein
MASLAVAEPGCGSYENAADLNAEYQSYEDMLGLASFGEPGLSTDSGLFRELTTVCGGKSFTAGTQVLLAGSTTKAISALKPGDKVLATNVKTGKTQAETVTAVEVRHDTDLYNLTVKTSRSTGVIHTTASHLFWDPYLKQWSPASKLRRGEHLKTANGTTAVADGGTTPKVHDGWMWDLTVPGNNDHDFYVLAGQSRDAPVLVHNANGPGCGDPLPTQTTNNNPLTPSQSQDLAQYLGFRKTNFRSSGQAVFTDGKWFISQDITSHNGGTWKIARSAAALGSKQTRTGTTDALLTLIGG